MKLIVIITLCFGSFASAFEIPTPRERHTPPAPKAKDACECEEGVCPAKAKKLLPAHCRDHSDGSLSWVAADGYRYSYDAETVRLYGLLALLPVIEKGHASACASGSCATGAVSGPACANGSCSGPVQRGLFRRR